MRPPELLADGVRGSHVAGAERIFSMSGISKVYSQKSGNTHAVSDVDLDGYAGDFIVLLGPSGSGKTTLLSVLAGLLQPSGGNLQIFGRDILALSPSALQQLRAERMGFVFQNFQLFDVLKVEENIALVQRFKGDRARDAKIRAAELLDMLGIAHLAGKYPGQISQGEKQRVAIARALANRPALLLADEPTASLESRQGQEVIRILRECAARMKCCVVCATHDLRISDCAGRIIRLEDGRRVDISETEAHAAPLMALA
jgi:putative ABC transport system ATP-binding protein